MTTENQLEVSRINTQKPLYRKPVSLIIGALFIVGVASFATIHGHGGGAIGTAVAAASAPAVDVDVATVVSQSITEWESYSGRLEAIDKVDVRPEVSGKIVAVHFKDGALVKKGELLFTIDPQPYAAEVERALAQVAAAEARAGYAAADAARADRLLDGNAIARRDFDEKHNAALEARANLKAANAALSAARISLSHTQIVAPVSGRVSRAELTVGNFVAAGASAPSLTTLVSLSPIYASFDVDEQTYLRSLRKSAGANVPVALGLADEDGYSRQGTVVSVDNQLNAQSGTIRVRAKFDNADNSLLPGLFARVKVGGDKPHPAVMVSDAAIGTDQAKKFVLVVDQESHVQYREVVPGNLHDGLRVITSGLKANDRIVVDGMQRVRPNDSVRVRVVGMVDGAAVDAKSDAKPVTKPAA
jgi:multidrug efflux system membrane fusion protein